MDIAIAKESLDWIQQDTCEQELPAQTIEEGNEEDLEIDMGPSRDQIEDEAATNRRVYRRGVWYFTRQQSKC